MTTEKREVRTIPVACSSTFEGTTRLETVIIRVQASGVFNFTEFTDEKAPTSMDWNTFKALADDGTFEPLVTVEVIREAR